MESTNTDVYTCWPPQGSCSRVNGLIHRYFFMRSLGFSREATALPPISLLLSIVQKVSAAKQHQFNFNPSSQSYRARFIIFFGVKNKPLRACHPSGSRRNDIRPCCSGTVQSQFRLVKDLFWHRPAPGTYETGAFFGDNNHRSSQLDV